MGYNLIRKKSRRRWRRSKIARKLNALGGRRNWSLCRTTHRVKLAKELGSIESRLIPKIYCILQIPVLNKNRRTLILTKNSSDHWLRWELNISRRYGLPSVHDNLQKSTFHLVSPQCIIFDTRWLYHFEVYSSQTNLCDRWSQLASKIP